MVIMDVSNNVATTTTSAVRTFGSALNNYVVEGRKIAGESRTVKNVKEEADAIGRPSSLVGCSGKAPRTSILEGSLCNQNFSQLFRLKETRTVSSKTSTLKTIRKTATKMRFFASQGMSMNSIQ